MSIFAEQKRNNLAQVSADSVALTRKRLEEDLSTLGVNAPSKVAKEQAEKERKEEAEESAETQIRVESGKAKPGANSTQKGAN